MIFSNDCWVKDTCKKYKREDCECKKGDVYCLKLFKLNELYNRSLLEKNQRQRVLLKSEPCDTKMFKKLKEFDDNIVENVNNGKNLYIHSSTCGNGKTTWAVRMIQDYLNNIWPESNIECRALFINVPRYFLALKDSISNQNSYVDHIKKNILSADLVVWDDICTKMITTFESENLLSIIDTRMNSGKSNIFTSNMSEHDVYELLGTRLASRIIGYSEDITIYGTDKRGKNI